MMAEDDNKQEVQASASDQEHERCNQRLEISHESNALLEEASNDGIGYTSATPPDQRGTHSYQGSSGITVAETSFCIESASNVDCAVQPETVADVGIGNDTSCDEAALDDSDEEREAAGSLMADNERVGSHEIVVFSVNVPPSERPWIRFLRNPTKLFGPREADPALGRVNRFPEANHNHENSPFSYKSWILRLSQRRRLEIFIAVGLFMWLAFFFVLAIFMNGKAHKHGDTTPGPGLDMGNVHVESPPTTLTVQVHIPNVTTEPITSEKTAKTEGKTMITSSHVQVNGSLSSIYHTSTKISPTASSAVSAQSNSSRSTDVGATTYDPSLLETRSTSTRPSLQEETTRPPDPQKTIPAETPTAEPNLVQTSSKQSHAASTTAATFSSSTAKDVEIGLDKFLANRVSYSDTRPLDFLSLLENEKSHDYWIGVGRGDITGPAADANMMGYANPNQVAGGIHFRQYARSYIVQQGSTRIVFVNVDACMGSMLVKLEVLKKLKKMYGDLYNAENVCISGTHTHSAPAGFLQDVLFQITSMGYLPETLDPMVDGIVESIRFAHDSLKPGYIFINKGELLESNVNRSPTAYLNNPPEERERYPYNVDKDMVLLKFVDKEGKGIGMINWFAVHCTSMNNTNSLISGDNKGYAELLFEQAMDPGSRPGSSSFVAAFAQSNEGDVSPNTRGPHCIDTGLPCDDVHSTCDGKVRNCIATGPGRDMFESTEIIGRRQFDKAMELYNQSHVLLHGPLQVAHQYVDMTDQKVIVNSTHSARTCKPAMGFSFAAGTTDGPGAFDFKQGDRHGNKFWALVRDSMHPPSQEQKDCHHPKPILLDTGEMNSPYSWQPNIVDTQLLRIGQLLLSAVPGEFTTMSGRRLSQAVFKTFAKNYPDQKFESVIAGLSNTYSDYVATFEEYQVQRYEGASTIYGPHTLRAHIQQYVKLANALVQNTSLPQTTQARDMRGKLWSLLPGVIYDATWNFVSIGDVVKDAEDTYRVGESASVTFASGNPRNSKSNNMTFLTVERELSNGKWEIVYTDSSWETKFIWKRTSTIRGSSEVTVVWDIGPATTSGRYRIQHHGHRKNVLGWIYPYSGQSKVFEVQQAAS